MHHCHSMVFTKDNRHFCTSSPSPLCTSSPSSSSKLLRQQPLHQSHSAARLHLPKGELGNKERRPINNQASFFLSDKPSGRIQSYGTHPYEAFAWHLLQNPISPKHTKNSQGPTKANSKDPWDEIEVGTPKPHVFVRCGIQMRLCNMMRRLLQSYYKR